MGFSPDGKHLAVCARDEFDVLTLNADNGWTPALEKMPYYQKHKISGRYSVIHFAADSTVLMVVTNSLSLKPLTLLIAVTIVMKTTAGGLALTNLN